MVGLAAMSTPSSPETAVRSYLRWLEDPASAVDERAVARADEALVRASDPIERLHALAARDRARTADADALIEAFVAQAKAWADREDITVAAFQEIGVPADVLTRAGFTVVRRRSTGGARRTRAARTAGAVRAPQMPVDTIKSAVLRLPARFTLADVAREAGGGSPQTVRKAVDELISAGTVTKLGPDEGHQGPGRAPTVYRLAARP